MAVSGTQKTRIGASISGTAKKLTITAKSSSSATVVSQYRSIMHGVQSRIFGRVN